MVTTHSEESGGCSSAAQPGPRGRRRLARPRAARLQLPHRRHPGRDRHRAAREARPDPRAARGRGRALRASCSPASTGVELPLADDADHVRSWFVYVVALARGIDRERVIAELEREGSRRRATCRASTSRRTCASATASARGCARSPEDSRAHARAAVLHRARGGRPGARGRDADGRPGARRGARRLGAARARGDRDTRHLLAAAARGALQRRPGGRPRRRPRPHARPDQLSARARGDRARRASPAGRSRSSGSSIALCLRDRGPGSRRPGRPRCALDQRGAGPRRRARALADRGSGPAARRRLRPSRARRPASARARVHCFSSSRCRGWRPRPGFYFPGDFFMGEEVPPVRDEGLAAVHLGFHHGMRRRRARAESRSSSRGRRPAARCGHICLLQLVYGIANAFAGRLERTALEAGTGSDGTAPGVLRPELSARLARHYPRRPPPSTCSGSARRVSE